MSMVGVSFGYLVLQLVILLIACGSPLALMFMAFYVVGERNKKMAGAGAEQSEQFIRQEPITAVGLHLEADLFNHAAKVEIYRRGSEIVIRPKR